MDNKKDNIPFTYRRGKTEMIGRTKDDRKAMKIDTIMYWLYRMVGLIIIILVIFLNGTNGKMQFLYDLISKLYK